MYMLKLFPINQVLNHLKRISLCQFVLQIGFCHHEHVSHISTNIDMIC
jgi:hypothetical protein